MANQILSGMADQIRGSYFSIIYDEYTDISNKEQLTFCLGWVDESFNDHEEFLGFYEVPNIKSDTIVSAVRVILLRTQISLESCRSQCYDGASNMLRKRSVVVKQIIETQPKFFTHCHCYMLSLSVKEMTKESKILSNAMDTSAEITILIKYSPKREQMLEQIKELSLSIEDESERNQANWIGKLSTTRWTVRAKCSQRILENYSYLHELWSKCLEEPNLTRDVKTQIIGCKAQTEGFDLYFGLKLRKLLYSHTDKLSQTWKNVSC